MKTVCPRETKYFPGMQGVDYREFEMDEELPPKIQKGLKTQEKSLLSKTRHFLQYQGVNLLNICDAVEMGMMQNCITQNLYEGFAQVQLVSLEGGINTAGLTRVFGFMCPWPCAAVHRDKMYCINLMSSSKQNLNTYVQKYQVYGRECVLVFQTTLLSKEKCNTVLQTICINCFFPHKRRSH